MVKNKHWIGASLLSVLVGIILFGNFNRPDISEKSLRVETFERLNKIRCSKKEEILEYFAEIKEKADNVNKDEILLTIFEGIRKNNYSVPAKVEFELDVHFVKYYANFYDILFVDATGYVFHSVKKESDYMTNVISEMPETGLSKLLSKKEDGFFVDYEYYRPSGEAAAFFVVPRRNGEELMGWIILQASVNRINKMLTDYKNLGRTGEVYLINRNRLMLSDSRFIEDSTVLKLNVDTEAVEDAINGNSGEKVIVDYRGERVFSSYEEFSSFGNSSWILIAEIDEDEIYTDFYAKHKEFFSDEIVRFLKGRKIPRRKPGMEIDPVKRVDLNEFAKADPGEALKTHGVATCTSVAIIYPGKFGYLAHITPDDSLYEESSMVFRIFSGERTDLLRELIERVERYDIYPYEKEKLKIYIIAPHDASFRQALDRLIESGYELSNIYFAYNPTANNATVTLDMNTDQVGMLWRYEKRYLFERGLDVESLGEVLKKIVMRSA